MENQLNVGNQNTQQISQNPVNQQLNTQEKKTNFGVPVGTILVCFIIFGFGGYYLGQNTLNRPKLTSITQNQPTNVPLSLPTIDQTVSWKTYVNNKFAFEIKYPQNWISISEGPNATMLDLRAGKQISGTVQPRYDTINFTDKNNNKQFEIAIFDPYNVSFPISTKDFAENSYLYLNGGCDVRWSFTPTAITTIKVDSLSFLRVRGNSGASGSNTESICYYGRVQQGNLIVLSVLAGASSDNFSLFDQILSSFKYKTKYSDSDLGELKTADVLVQDGSYYGPPFDPNLYQLEVGQSNHLFAQSDAVNLKQYLGKRIKVHYREVKGIVMGEQQLVIVASVE